MAKRNIVFISTVILTFLSVTFSSNCLATSQSTSLDILGGKKGTLTSNVWRQTSADRSGNTLQWDWQVSAKYERCNPDLISNCFNTEVDWIKTAWKSTASLRNSSSMSMGIGGDSISASSSSSWGTYSTKPKYWMNTRGQHISDWRSNIVIGPANDYRENSITTMNTATVKFKNDPKHYEVTAGV